VSFLSHFKLIFEKSVAFSQSFRTHFRCSSAQRHHQPGSDGVSSAPERAEVVAGDQPDRDQAPAAQRHVQVLILQKITIVGLQILLISNICNFSPISLKDKFLANI
jgi:hypothetical protein